MSSGLHKSKTSSGRREREALQATDLTRFKVFDRNIYTLLGIISLRAKRQKKVFRQTFRLVKKFLQRRSGALTVSLNSLHLSNRLDCRIHDVQPDVCIVTFWIDSGGRQGPGLSLYGYGLEILRFDCFGPGQGHFHLTPLTLWKTEERIWFSELSIDDQIKRTIFELTHNLDYYLHLNPRPRIRKLKIDKKRIAEAAKLAGEMMRGQLELRFDH